MDNGRNKQATDFAVLILQKCLVEAKEEATVTASEFFSTIEALTKIAHRGAGPEGFVSCYRTNNSLISLMPSSFPFSDS